MKKIKITDLKHNCKVTSDSRLRLFADELIDFSSVTFNGENRLGKEGHCLKLLNVYDLEPEKSECSSDYIPNYLCLILSKFEIKRSRKNYLYAVYSTKLHKFIIPFEYGAVEIRKTCIIAYGNEGTVIFSHNGDVIMPATKNVRLKSLRDKCQSGSAGDYYFMATKLRDDWLEKCIESKICKYDSPTLFEEWNLMYEYNANSDELNGIYSVIEKKLVVPYKYANLYITSMGKNVRGTNKAYLVAFDGHYYTLYSPEGKCIVPGGKYDMIHVGLNRIIVRKELYVEKEEQGFKVKTKIGRRCLDIAKIIGDDNYLAHYRSKNLVDIYSFEGKIIKENVLLYNYSDTKSIATDLSRTYFIYFDEDEYKIKKKKIERVKRRSLQERISMIKDLKNTIKVSDLRCSSYFIRSRREHFIADELIDLNGINFNGEDRLGKKGHYLKLADICDIEPKKSHYALDYEPNYILRIVSEFEEDKYSKLFAVYSTKLHKFILPFEYGNLEFKGECIFAYRNDKMGIFSNMGEIIMPFTKNIRLNIKDKKHYVEITKLREDWLERCIESGICKSKSPTQFEKWRALYDYEIHNDELKGVYSLFEKKLIVPYEYQECFTTSPSQDMDEAFIKVYDGAYSYGIYTPEGKYIIPVGKYSDIFLSGKTILARKSLNVSGRDAYIEKTIDRKHPGVIEEGEIFHDAYYECKSIVDIYSLEGEIMEENVSLYSHSSSIDDAASLSCAYFDNFF